MLSKSWQYIALSLVTFLAYLPSLGGGFILDDSPLIKENPLVKEPWSLSSHFTQEDGASEIYQGGKSHTGYYRPLITLSYYIDHTLWGMNPKGFRATNLILHVLTCLMFYRLLLLLTGHAEVSFWCALIFALHPVNTEAVSWVSSRNNILTTLFGISAFLFYVLSWERGVKGALLLSSIFFAGALFSKEFGVVVLPLFFLYQRLVSQKPKDGAREFLSYIPYVLIIALYFFLRSVVTGNILPFSGSVFSRLYYAPYLLFLNLKLLFLPSGLHSFIVQYPTSFLSLGAFLGFLVLGLYAFIVYRNKEGITRFGLLAFLLAIFPVLNIAKSSAVTLVSMRWLYFPMIYLLMALTGFIGRIIPKKRALVIAALIAVSAYLGGYTYVLNDNLWRDEETFFYQEVVQFKNLFYAGGYAGKLLDRGSYAEAEVYFRIALERYPKSAKNYIDYSALLIDTSRFDAAVECLIKAKSLTMTLRDRGEWANNMGMALFKKGSRSEALTHLKEAVKIYPFDPLFWSNLSIAYGAMDDYENSLASLQKGLEMMPDSLKLKKTLAMTYIRRGETDKAIAVLEAIPHPLRMGDTTIDALFNQAREGKTHHPKQ